MREDWNWKEKDGDKIYATWKESVIKTWNRKNRRVSRGKYRQTFPHSTKKLYTQKKKMKHCAARPNCLNFG